MNQAIRLAMKRRWAGLMALCLGFGLSGCGKESLTEALAGTYATDSVQAELEEHEREFISGDLHGKFDALDRAEAAEEGEVWARLRLHGDGRFEYEGPASEEGTPDARLWGRWTARPASVDLVVEKAGGTDAEEVPKTLTCPAIRGSIELPFLNDPKTRRPLRLARR